MPASTITVYKFWQDLGTMGITAHLTSAADGPTLTSANLARMRVRSTAGSVVHWDADILDDPAATATTCSVRHVLEPGDLVVGTYSIFAEVSLDAGATWFAQLVPIEMKVIDG